MLGMLRMFHPCRRLLHLPSISDFPRWRKSWSCHHLHHRPEGSHHNCWFQWYRHTLQSEDFSLLSWSHVQTPSHIWRFAPEVSKIPSTRSSPTLILKHSLSSFSQVSTSPSSKCQHAPQDISPSGYSSKGVCLASLHSPVLLCFMIFLSHFIVCCLPSMSHKPPLGWLCIHRWQ